MGNQVKEFRKRRGFTQKELALKAGVPRSSIAEIEANIRTPSVDIAILIARALGAAVEDIFFVS